jgi:hypothetical protein
MHKAAILKAAMHKHVCYYLYGFKKWAGRVKKGAPLVHYITCKAGGHKKQYVDQNDIEYNTARIKISEHNRANLN